MLWYLGVPTTTKVPQNAQVFLDSLGFLARDSSFQNSLSGHRCHPISVPGFTSAKASFQL